MPGTGNVLADDTLASAFTKFLVQDENGDFVEVSEAKTVIGDHGTLTINPDGSYSYVPNTDFEAINQVDEFTYRLEHPNGTVADATLSITIENGTGPYVPPAPAMAFFDDVVALGEFNVSDADEMEVGGLSLDQGDLLDFGEDVEIDLANLTEDAGGGAPSSEVPENGTATSAGVVVEDPFSIFDDRDDDLSASLPII